MGLKLPRKSGQSIFVMFGDKRAKITFDRDVSVWIEAPDDVRCLRGELVEPEPEPVSASCVKCGRPDADFGDTSGLCWSCFKIENGD